MKMLVTRTSLYSWFYDWCETNELELDENDFVDFSIDMMETNTTPYELLNHQRVYTTYLVYTNFLQAYLNQRIVKPDYQVKVKGDSFIHQTPIPE